MPHIPQTFLGSVIDAHLRDRKLSLFEVNDIINVIGTLGAAPEDVQELKQLRNLMDSSGACTAAVGETCADPFVYQDREAELVLNMFIARHTPAAE